MASPASWPLVCVGTWPGLARPGRCRDGDQPDPRRRPLHIRRRLGRLLVRARGVHGDRRVRGRDPRDPARDEGVRASRPARLPRGRAPRPSPRDVAAGGIAALVALVLAVPLARLSGLTAGLATFAVLEHRERGRTELAAGDARHVRRVRHPDGDDDLGSARLGAGRDGGGVGVSAIALSACACGRRARTRRRRARSGSVSPASGRSRSCSPRSSRASRARSSACSSARSTPTRSSSTSRS